MAEERFSEEHARYRSFPQPMRDTHSVEMLLLFDLGLVRPLRITQFLARVPCLFDGLPESCQLETWYRQDIYTYIH